MDQEFTTQGWGGELCIFMHSMPVASYTFPTDRALPIRVQLNLQRRHWKPSRPVTSLEVADRDEAFRRMDQWLVANRDRLFREVAAAKYPGEAPERALKRLERELRG